MKRDKYIEARGKFCETAMNDPKKAAEELRSMAIGLESCKYTSDKITALSTIFAVSERTIERHFES